MRPRTLLVLAVVTLALPALGGCLDFGGLSRPDYRVSRTALAEGEWTTDGTFIVQVQQDAPVEVRVEGVGPGADFTRAGTSNASTPFEVDLPDGTWTITYFVGGHEWESFKDVRVDTVPPEITGVETVVKAPTGSATLGANAQVEDGADLAVTKLDGTVVGDGLPLMLTGLPDGVHVYQVTASDAAGNEETVTVQVISGSATELPDPIYTAGIVSRYTTELRLWDLTDLGAFVSPATARSRVMSAYGSDYLGEGTGLKPDDPEVQRVVGEVVEPGMTTGEAALALYHWLYDHVDYDKARLEEDDLLDPAETIAAGGGVCRDLAALYASLLRAAGIPSRLVAGYLAGDVDGFHAWVEFYGGLDPVGSATSSGWVPVDVSGVNGPYKVTGMLQAFGIALPEHLAMRALTPQEEKTDWSTAAILLYSGGEPDAPFEKHVDLVLTNQTLCVNLDTFARKAQAQTTCGRAFQARIDGFAVAATGVLDYGILVRSAPKGTELTLSIVYPDAETVAPDEVEYRTYFEPSQPRPSTLRSTPFDEDPVRGRADATIRA